MNLTYYQILSLSYLTALGLWWMLTKKYPETFLLKPQDEIKKPWVQVVLLLVCGMATVGIGRLYTMGYLFPDVRWGLWRVGESVNQMLIFSPFPLFLGVSKQSLGSAWLSGHRALYRFGAGFFLGLAALVVFALLAGRNSLVDVIGNVYHPQNLHYGVQIFFEDFAIALLLSRLAAAITHKYFGWAVLAVALLFPLGHLPANLDGGTPLMLALTNLSLDALLVFGVGMALYRSKDFLWLFPIHFAMDMMQFYSGLQI